MPLPVRAVEPMHLEERMCKLLPPDTNGMKRLLSVRTAAELDALFHKLVPPSQRLSQLSACRDAFCKVGQVFGAELGIKLLYMLDRFGLNASHFQDKRAQAWTESELAPILAALHDFPPGVAKFNKPILRFKHGAIVPRIREIEARTSGSCVAADTNKQMIFFDCYFERSESVRQITAFHELGHVIGDRGELDQSEEWKRFSGWKNDGNGRPVPTIEGCLVSTYGMNSEDEDFATSLEAYRYNPADLKSRCPSKYAFLKDQIFEGQEYIEEASCSTDSSRN